MGEGLLRQGAALLAGGMVLGVLAAPGARAQDAARIEAIERQIRALQTELNRMRRDMQTREAETRAAKQEAAQARSEAQAAQRRLDLTPPPVTAAQVAPEERTRLTFPGYRPTLTSADGRFSFSIGTQTQFDVGGYLRGPPPTPNTRGVPNLDTFGSNLRRARLFFSARYEDFVFNITPDFGNSPDGAPTLYEANFNWLPVRPLTLTLGYFKPWVTLQDSMSSNDFFLLERPSIVEIARNIAAGDARASVGAKWATDRYFLSAYLTGTSFGSNLAAQGVPDQTGAVGRVAGRPFTNPDIDVHTGFSALEAFDIKRTSAANNAIVQQITLSDRPELRIDQSRLITTGALNAGDAYAWGPEFGLRWRNFLLQGEYIQIGVNQLASTNPRRFLMFDGGYVEVSWVITGEPRRYSAAAAAFARPIPAHPFSLEPGGGWGAWELVARYSVADMNSKVQRGVPQAVTGGVFGGRQEIIGVGLSWYPNNLLRFVLQADSVQVDRRNPAGTTQIGQRFWDVALRTQIAF
ncbi:MAG TPA: porin [Crenalkalicoccus sp.]|nr:porin [Crenalkalicoccus sp.]